MKKYRKPYQVKRKKPIYKNRFFWLGLLVLIIFGGFFYLACFYSHFQIKEIKISGNQKVSAEGLGNLIEEKISQKILFFDSKSIFLVNLSEIKKEILKNFPQVAEVKLKREFPDILLAQIGERKPIAIFCQNTNCFFIDTEGIIFEETIPEEGLIKLVSEENTFALGERVIEKDYLENILKIQKKLVDELRSSSPSLRSVNEEIKIEAKEFIVSSDRLTAKTLEGWEIYLDPEGDIAWQLTKLRVVLEEEIPPEKRKGLEYIDLRFGNFAPYKYRD